MKRIIDGILISNNKSDTCSFIVDLPDYEFEKVKSLAYCKMFRIKKAKEIKTELECYKIAIDYGEQKKIELEWKNE